MNLVWKLLRQHISVPQFVGFFFANLFGMIIVLLGFQFYRDVLPIFTQQDSFMGADYLIVSKQISTATTFSGRDNTFSPSEIADMKSQRFVKKQGQFTSTAYKVDAHMGINGVQILNSEMFFESVPDEFIDVSTAQWQWHEGDKIIPIILPQTYINMYNFGFAQTHSMPKISQGLAGMIDFHIFIHGNDHNDEYKGKVIGFSTRLNSILIPQSFMEWSNSYYSTEKTANPTRLIVEVANPADEHITKYLDSHQLEVEDDNLDSEKTTYFLKLVVTLVMGIGLVISVLSFYILMLSVYLLVQKNASKLENLLLIGYSPNRVALPYQSLTIGLNIIVLVIALAILSFLRSFYMDTVEAIYPNLDETTLWPSILLGFTLFVLISIFNILAIRNKVINIWKRKE